MSSSSSFNSSDDNLTFDGFLDNILVDFPPQSPISFSPGSDYNSTAKTNTSSSSSDGETNQWEANLVDEERKKKRKISNRESAKRSRVRKQKHLESLTDLVTRYKSGNQELINRLRFLSHNWQIIQQENERMQAESVMLQQKLYKLHQLLVVPELHQVPFLQSAWPCNNNVTTINEQNLPSLITHILI